ncbi:UDP-glucose 4-epimerase [Paraburkholderia strydomiana]|uniref:UDP-glucose 4-epimerase n=1 Tax=Paraburkholderia strydomiana TaxID=1245417 RepID=UPI0038BB89A5
MTLTGNVGDGHWSVSAVTHSTTGGFDCSIKISHAAPEGDFNHEFKHSSIWATEREAVLAGLREGMVWVQLKMSNTLSIGLTGTQRSHRSASEEACHASVRAGDEE